MRERKRLEHVLATEAELGRHGEDIAAYLSWLARARKLMRTCAVKLIHCAI